MIVRRVLYPRNHLLSPLSSLSLQIKTPKSSCTFLPPPSQHSSSTHTIQYLAAAFVYYLPALSLDQSAQPYMTSGLVVWLDQLAQPGFYRQILVLFTGRELLRRQEDLRIPQSTESQQVGQD